MLSQTAEVDQVQHCSNTGGANGACMQHGMSQSRCICNTAFMRKLAALIADTTHGNAAQPQCSSCTQAEVATCCAATARTSIDMRRLVQVQASRTL